jgi:hypothetical protein
VDEHDDRAVISDDPDAEGTDPWDGVRQLEGVAQ